MNTYMTLAKLNIKNRKTKFFSVILLLAVLLFLLTLSVSHGFVTICNSYKTDDVALRQIEAFPVSDNGNVIPYDQAISEKVSKVNHVAEAHQTVSVDLQHEYTVKVGKKHLPVIIGFVAQTVGFPLPPCWIERKYKRMLWQILF